MFVCFLGVIILGSLEGTRIWVKEIKNAILTHVEVIGLEPSFLEIQTGLYLMLVVPRLFSLSTRDELWRRSNIRFQWKLQGNYY